VEISDRNKAMIAVAGIVGAFVIYMAFGESNKGPAFEEVFDPNQVFQIKCNSCDAEYTLNGSELAAVKSDAGHAREFKCKSCGKYAAWINTEPPSQLPGGVELESFASVDEVSFALSTTDSEIRMTEAQIASAGGDAEKAKFQAELNRLNERRQALEIKWAQMANESDH
jgi:hypothetical protein